jgi:alkanesulfonate monooxygenase SsuD/methylene tetrahydromethanopterin reductase-like flavin-dependent oxidoreductase (luciferase family)
LIVTRSSSETEQELEKRKATIALIHVLPGMHQQLQGLESKFPIDQILDDVRRVMRTEEVLARGGSFMDLRAAGNLPAARKLIPLELVQAVTLVGSIDAVKSGLQAYAKAGVTDVIVDPGSVRDPDLFAELSAIEHEQFL